MITLGSPTYHTKRSTVYLTKIFQSLWFLCGTLHFWFDRAAKHTPPLCDSVWEPFLLRIRSTITGNTHYWKTACRNLGLLDEKISRCYWNQSLQYWPNLEITKILQIGSLVGPRINHRTYQLNSNGVHYDKVAVLKLFFGQHLKYERFNVSILNVVI